MTTKPITFNVHLVSDSTGETLSAIMRSCVAQFENVEALEHTYYLIRSEQRLQRVLDELRVTPGLVMFTIAEEKLRASLERECRLLGVPYVSVLDQPLKAFSRYLGLEMSHKIGAQREMTEEYFRRIEALNFAMAHDDGQNTDDYDEADVILLGVSRTSKTPTSIYLGQRGVKVANLPLVPGASLPPIFARLTKPLVVGLTINLDRLVQIRANRLSSLAETRQTDYIDEDRVRAEIIAAKHLYEKHGWPVIDVTRRSVEETAAAILALLRDRAAPR